MVPRWALAALLVRPCPGKRVVSSVTLSGAGGPGDRWEYMSKFGYYEGAGDYGVRLRVADPGGAQPGGRGPGDEVGVVVEVHLDEQWDGTQLLPQCERGAAAKRTVAVGLPTSGAWSSWYNGTLIQRVRPHIWYFALQACHGGLRGPTRIDFDFHASQEGGSELSVELYGTPFVAVAKLLLGLPFLAWFAQGCLRFRRSAGRLHPVIVVLAAAVVAQYAAYACHAGHLWAYRGNGRGVRALDVLGELGAMLSQTLVSSLSLFLAQGYTILPGEHASLRFTARAFGLIALAHLAVVGLAKFRDDASFKFHENEGACGWVLVALRAGLYAWFFVSMRLSYADAPPKIRPFLTQFHCASLLHYLAYPALFLVAALFAPYLRHKAMLVGLFLLQASSLAWYTRMFLTRGLYFEVSSLGGNLLPTPKGSRSKPRMFAREKLH